MYGRTCVIHKVSVFCTDSFRSFSLFIISSSFTSLHFILFVLLCLFSFYSASFYSSTTHCILFYFILFYQSISDGAQTREHAVLLKALGVKQIIVAVNKMDNSTPPWSQDRFNLIESQIRFLLEELQFSKKSIRFIPLSGLSGENLVTLR